MGMDLAPNRFEGAIVALASVPQNFACRAVKADGRDELINCTRYSDFRRRAMACSKALFQAEAPPI